ncbi:MAG: hypothetical protein K2L17_10465 [Muribaculaceae bacterium]|nr:hypothetical protein [Muribaculaceae bacterium]
MKNPLTSKERRGLLAVAAAALLCISSAFIFRNCSSHSHQPDNHPSEIGVSQDSTIVNALPEDTTDFKAINKQKNKKGNKQSKAKRKRIKKAPKAYPVRDPLSEPCDQ